jgi:hypothetical protein
LRRSASRTASSVVAVGPSFTPIGLCTPEKNSTWAPSGVARAIPDPEHVRRAVVRQPRQRVRAGQRLLVVEEQTLVTRPDVDLVDRPLASEVEPDRLHEAQRALDLVGERLVASSGG